MGGDDPAGLPRATLPRVSESVKYCGTSVNHRLRVGDRDGSDGSNYEK